MSTGKRLLALPFALLLILPALAACTAEMQDQVARDAAKATVGKVIVQGVPNAPVQGSVDCIIENANRDELLALASEAVTGPTQSSFEIVSHIASKAETINCLVGRGLPSLIQ